MLSCSLVYGVIGAIAVAMGRVELEGFGLVVSVVFSSWIVPTLGAWVAVEGLNFISPRRVLDRRLSMPLKRIALGVAAGMLGSVAGVLGMAALDATVMPDAAIMGLASALAALATLVPMERSRRGVCVQCGYSQAGATPGARGVCAECGVSVYGA